MADVLAVIGDEPSAVAHVRQVNVRRRGIPIDLARIVGRRAGRVMPRVDHWFQKPVQLALAAVVGEINRLNDLAAADALRVALSSIIVRVSNQDSDTRYTPNSRSRSSTTSTSDRPPAGR